MPEFGHPLHRIGLKCFRLKNAPSEGDSPQIDKILFVGHRSRPFAAGMSTSTLAVLAFAHGAATTFRFPHSPRSAIAAPGTPISESARCGHSPQKKQT